MAALRSRTSKHRPPEAHALATAEDVEACYRLLLGRAPDEDGRRYWAAAVGRMTVPELVGAFIDSREFHIGDLYRRITAAAPTGEAETSPAVMVELSGRNLFVDPDDRFVGGTIARDREYEPHLSRALAEALRPGDGFVDVGANIGWFSLLAASVVGADGRVLAVEADPANVGLLLRSAKASGFGNVTAVSAAAGAGMGAVLLQRAGGSNGAVYPAGEGAAPGDRWVPSITLDSLSGMIDKVGVVKIDVEGAELLALRGGTEMIARHRPLMFVEFSPGMLSRFADSGPRELQSWLDEHDYHPAIVAFGGEVVEVTSLQEVESYCRAGGHQHVDLRLTP